MVTLAFPSVKSLTSFPSSSVYFPALVCAATASHASPSSAADFSAASLEATRPMGFAESKVAVDVTFSFTGISLLLVIPNGSE